MTESAKDLTSSPIEQKLAAALDTVGVKFEREYEIAQMTTNHYECPDHGPVSSIMREPRCDDAKPYPACSICGRPMVMSDE